MRRTRSSRRIAGALCFLVGLVVTLSAPARAQARTYGYDAVGNRATGTQLIRFTSAGAFAIEPRRAMAGERVNLYGRNFPVGQIGAVVVQFNGTTATVLNVSERVITVVVPANVTAGPVTVSVHGGPGLVAGDLALQGIAVTPAVIDLDYSEQVQFGANVIGGTNAVTWSVSDLSGATTNVGTITAAGIYTAPPLNSPRDFPFLVRATSVDLRISAYALVKLKSIGLGAIANRTIVSGTFGASFERQSVEFTGQPGKHAYIVAIGTTTLRSLTLRDSRGIAIARTGPGARLRLADVPIPDAQLYRVEVHADSGAGRFQLWVDQHGPLPRGVWMFPGDESWHVAANWSNGVLPAAGDEVFVPRMTGAMRVSVTQSVTCSRIESDEGLSVASATFTIDNRVSEADSVIRGGLELVGGTLAGNGNVVVGGASTWSGGSMSGSGRTTIAAGGTLAMTGTSTFMDLARTLENQGTVTWSGGSAWRWLGGTFVNASAASFVASSAATMDSYGISGTNVFQNTGSFIKLGAGAAQLRVANTGIAFNNTGTVNVQGGSLQLAGGGTGSGSFTLAAGTTLSLAGTHALATSTFTGTGGGTLGLAGSVTASGAVSGLSQVSVSGGSSTLSGAVSNLGRIDATVGSVLFSGTLASVTTLSITGGGVDFGANSVAVANGLTMSTGSLGGSGAVTLSSASTWSGGSMSGSGRTIIAAGGTLAMTGTTTVMDLARTLENQGTVTWSGGNAWRWLGGTFVNASAASFVASSAASLDSYGISGTNVFQNTGSFIKLGAGAAQLRVANTGIAFNNTGTVDVQGGNLQLAGGGTGSGSFALANGTTLSLAGTHALGSSSVSGTGTATVTVGSGSLTSSGIWSGTSRLEFNGGSSTFTGAVTTSLLQVAGGVVNFNTSSPMTSGALNLSSGTLSGSADVTLSGASTWSGGSMSGSGRMIIAAGGTLAMTGTTTVMDLARTLENQGTVTWSGGNAWRWLGGTFVNASAASFVASSAASLDSYGISGTNVFQNTGSFIKLGAGAAQLRVANTGIAFNNTGTVNVQGGSLQLAGGGTGSGSFTLAAGTTLSLAGTHALATSTFTGTGGGTLGLAGSVTASGAVSGLSQVSVSGGSSTLSGAVSNLGRIDATVGSVLFSGTLASVTTLSITGGGVDFGANSVAVANGLTMSTGSLGGSGAVTLSSASTWSGGSMSGSGRTIIAAGGTLAMTGTTTVMDLARTLENQGTVTWSGGNAWRWLGGTFVNASAASFVASSAASLDSYGISGTNVFQNTGSFIKLGAGAAQLRVANTGIAFNNTGTVNVQGGSLQLAGGGTGSGSFTLAAGTTLSLAGTHALATSTFTGTGGGTLGLAGSVTASGAVSGLSQVSVSGGSSTLSGAVSNLGRIDATVGSVLFSGTLASVTTLSITGGGVDFGANSVAVANGLTMSTGSLGGSGAVTLSSASTWSGGSMSGSGRTIIAAGGTLAMTGTTTVMDLARTLENQGTVTWSGGNAWRWLGGTFVNASAASFVASSAASLDSYGISGTNVFQNTGSFIKLGAGAAQLRVANTGIAFNNTGTVNVQGGSLQLAGGGTGSGSFTLAAGTTLSLAGTHALATSTFTGTGGGTLGLAGSVTASGAVSGLSQVSVSGGSSTLSGAVSNLGRIDATVGSVLFSGTLASVTTLSITGGGVDFGANSVAVANGLTMSTGSLGGSGAVTLSSASTWSGGSMSGSGRTIIAAGGTLAMTGTTTVMDLARTLENQGTVTWSGGNAWRWLGGTFVNASAASFVASSAATMDSYGNSGTNVFQNMGTFTKQGAGAAQLRVNSTSIAFNNTGTVDVQGGTLLVTNGITQTAGRLILSGGSLTAPLQIQSGTLEGVGTVTGNVVNSGIVSPGGRVAGALQITGTYSQTSTGTLDLDLGGTTPGAYDRLQVTGAATLGGTLRITLIASFVPVLNDTFDVLAYASRAQSFANCTGCGLPNLRTLVPTYAATLMQLVVQ